MRVADHRTAVGDRPPVAAVAPELRGRTAPGETRRRDPHKVRAAAMPRADFFARLGLLVVKDFFDADYCARLRSEVRSAASTRATVVGKAHELLVEPSTRSASWAEVSAATRSFVGERLARLKPVAERHFGMPLAGYQNPQFLIYREKDHYRPHQDRSRDSSGFVKERRVSAVIFLSSEAEEPREGAYCGGSLTFYGLIDDPRGSNHGFPLSGEAGLLIAFRPEVVHEVTPVTEGERYTIATWFY
jgi:predicted 2-oxoglutarate/Fe(II)-dependent dioxygenase YbiX